MPKPSFILTLLALGVLGRTALTGQDAARVVILPSTDAPIVLNAARVATDSSTVTLTATNNGSKNVKAYTVSVFWFPTVGRHGFATQAQRPSAILSTGASHEAAVPLRNGVTLDSSTTLIIAARSAAFDDGTSWNNDDVSAQVDAKARELGLP
jgi:hypothetical protein